MHAVHSKGVKSGVEIHQMLQERGEDFLDVQEVALSMLVLTTLPA